MPEKNYNSSNYNLGFSGKLKENSIEGENNAYDYGSRILDVRIGPRWLSPDPEAKRYPGYSLYNYALNTPISATDPDGKVVIFIGGLRLWVGQGDQAGSGYITGDSHQGIYNYDIFKYWSTEKNSFGRSVDMAGNFINRIGDNNAWYTSGSSTWTSQPSYRIEQGKEKAQMFNAMVRTGAITLAKDETIKIVCHSQGGAFAEGFAEQLLSYKDADGKSLYNIEVVYFITPHQSDKFSFNLPMFEAFNIHILAMLFLQMLHGGYQMVVQSIPKLQGSKKVNLMDGILWVVRDNPYQAVPMAIVVDIM